MRKLLLLPAFLTIATISCNAPAPEEQKPEPADKVELGKMLFSDAILSDDHSVSCASCHIPEHAFADTSALSKGVGGKRGTRNTPSSMNLSARNSFFWDGRAASMEEQASGPIENPAEMNLPVAEAVKRLNADPDYSKWFRKLYGELPNRANLLDAIVSFERTLETSATPFDRFMKGDEKAISDAAKRGQQIFNIKAKCFDCHFGPDFTGDQFRNIGLYNGKELSDKGRSEISKDSADIGKFKTPGLRNVSVTGPYMHNGMFRTLEEVIEHYNDPEKFVKGAINSDTLMQKLNLSSAEKSDLLEFLKTLTDDRFQIRQ
ncbi:MAG: cytochrome-c peroxidase [Bacteroidia bacterium]